MVWLNGNVIYNSLTVVPQNQEGYFDYTNSSATKVSKDKVETPKYKTTDISEYKSVLRDGKNTLTYWNTNGKIDSQTLAAALRLSLTK